MRSEGYIMLEAPRHTQWLNEQMSIKCYFSSTT